MSTHTLFQVNRPQVICQTIEGEAVVINLHTGAYYSLTGAAAAIWDAVEHGKPAAQIQSSLVARFTDCEAGLEKIVADFLQELSGESLIVPAENGRPPGEAAPTNGVPIVREKFARPALKKFTDMEELLLLDPVHEVDATGWPMAKLSPSGHAGE